MSSLFDVSSSDIETNGKRGISNRHVLGFPAETNLTVALVYGWAKTVSKSLCIDYICSKWANLRV